MLVQRPTRAQAEQRAEPVKGGGRGAVRDVLSQAIQDGDIIVIEKRETAENGESVVAMINGERATLKRFYIEADGIRLQPANPAMAPIYLRHEELQILGIVSGVIRCGQDQEPERGERAPAPIPGPQESQRGRRPLPGR
ncbi:MAG TPA: S24 family peptidase [Lamprocystis sp. (in: g-proteobacteria)]|nr:S24 family peptidase [Lamprocystis sp. (in: g-proteobacteria)]